MLSHYICNVHQVLGPGEGDVHPLDGEEGGEVGGVAGDHQQREHPPQTGQRPGAGRPGMGKLNKTSIELLMLKHALKHSYI